jgi:hypothetical protein
MAMDNNNKSAASDIHAPTLGNKASVAKYEIRSTE